ncbi:MAG: hypothetical protein SPL79_03455 [Sphaerochaetaceae bacterium]|nr:hypothetical protein [Sphaerochaetaceae bacterium]
MGKMKGKNHHPVATKVVYAFCVGLSALVFPGCATEAQVRYTIPASEAIREKTVIATRKYLGMPDGADKAGGMKRMVPSIALVLW